jgi:hypothetical protein
MGSHTHRRQILLKSGDDGVAFLDFRGVSVRVTQRCGKASVSDQEFSKHAASSTESPIFF